MTPKKRVLLAVISLLLSALPGLSGAAPQRPATNRDALLTQAFEKRVGLYVKLRKQMEAGLPPLKTTRSAAKLAQHQRALAEKIRAARKDARQGVIFTPEIAAEFRRLIAIAMRGPDAARIRSSLSGAGSAQWHVYVDEIYPERAPLPTTPPTLLLNLPKLPPELDYRFVGQDMVLRDADADLVVDFIPGALP